MGACDVVVAALRGFPDSQDVVATAVLITMNLISHDNEVQEVWDAGVVEEVIQTVFRFPDITGNSISVCSILTRVGKYLGARVMEGTRAMEAVVTVMRSAAEGVVEKGILCLDTLWDLDPAGALGVLGHVLERSRAEECKPVIMFLLKLLDTKGIYDAMRAAGMVAILQARDVGAPAWDLGMFLLYCLDPSTDILSNDVLSYLLEVGEEREMILSLYRRA